MADAKSLVSLLQPPALPGLELSLVAFRKGDVLQIASNIIHSIVKSEQSVN